MEALTKQLDYIISKRLVVECFVAAAGEKSDGWAAEGRYGWL